jgi:putative membrane protein
MVKRFVQNIAIYMYSLFVLPKVVPGVEIDGGFMTFLWGGVALSVMFMIIKPILNIISFPINMLTLGLFSTFTNAFIIYLLTIFFTEISVKAFTYPSTHMWGFVTPDIDFNTFFAYIYTAIVLAIIDSAVKWLMK